jgi:Xaa-Pro dipeptidase
MSPDHRAARRTRLRELMERRGAGAVVLRRPENFAWYTGGGNSRVEYASPVGVADVVLTADGEWVLTSTIEGPRMRDEEAVGFEVVEYPWEQGPDAALSELTEDRPVAADVPLDGAAVLGEDLDAIRRVLDFDAIERLRAVGADLSTALQEAAGAVAPGMTEHRVADEIAAACRCRAWSPPCCSPPPTSGSGSTAIRCPRPRRSTAGRCWSPPPSAAASTRTSPGLSCSRSSTPGSRADRTSATRSSLGCATRRPGPGRTVAEAFADCRRFYAEAGYSDEWRLHHQGGITGYASREVIATPASEVEIEAGQAFAWNPSITGAKAEETFVLTDSGSEVVAGARTPVV